MEPILPPAPAPTPAPADAPAPAHRRRGWQVTPRPGHLTGGWATVYWLGWLLVAGGFGAVWYSARVTGLSTWWLGPESEPRVLLCLVPFIAPFALAFLAIRITRHLPWYGIGGAVVTAAIAAGDLADVPRYAAIEFALAGAGLAVSVASFAGMLRAAEPALDEPQAGEAEG
jgi:hypothetical protein